MRSLVIIGIASAFVGTPPMSQTYGGGMNNSMGMGPPPITQPVVSVMDARNAAKDDASQRDMPIQEIAELQSKSPGELKALAVSHRKSAEALATAARAGAAIPAIAKDRIRGALAEDIAAWRIEFHLGRQEWQAMRDQWLGNSGSKTANDWAIRRADWFAARDSWIGKQASLTLAQTHR